MSRIVLVLLASSLLIITACSLNQTSDPAISETIVLETPPSGEVESTTRPAVENPLPEPTATHVDDVLGYAFDYPADWRVDSRPGDLTMLFSYSENEVGPGGGGVPDDLTKIDFIVSHPNSPYSTVDSYLDFARQKNDGPGGNVIAEERLTLGGFPAARLTFSGGMVEGETPSAVVEVNGKLLHITGYGDTSLFDAILSTLRPA